MGDSAGLRNMAKHVLVALSEETAGRGSGDDKLCSNTGSLPQQLSKAQAAVKWITFRRCLMLYPEQMMFAVLRVMPKARQETKRCYSGVQAQSEDKQKPRMDTCTQVVTFGS